MRKVIIDEVVRLASAKGWLEEDAVQELEKRRIEGGNLSLKSGAKNQTGSQSGLAGLYLRHACFSVTLRRTSWPLFAALPAVLSAARRGKYIRPAILPAALLAARRW
jgi:hypothetical protein